MAQWLNHVMNLKFLKNKSNFQIILFFSFYKRMNSKYVSVNKVIDELINANIIDENDCLNIYFSDFHNSKYFQNSWTIKPIGFKVIKNVIVKNNWKVMKSKGKDPEYIEITYQQIWISLR